ncbi:uncharacterized protein LOC117917441 [Vitis riparia]|uniref:uncharacterized protein LOC117917441 n=1 Tax=Vitis riparia TaxID=96939 RepID=UPI00155B0197|nr:uncharacterized protein LOC117917441 [Vitis riparia]
MDKTTEQMRKTAESEEKGGKLEGLPMETSPYTQYSDLEDYKRKGYGTEGHLQPKPGRGSSTDAPTISGASVSSRSELSSTDAKNRHGVP